MGILELQVISPNYNITVPLERRIVYIRGDSGIGKTTLVDIVRRSGTDRNVVIVNPLNHLIVLDDTIPFEMITGVRDSIFIADDLLLTEDAKVSAALPKVLSENNNYIIIINRVDNSGHPFSGKSDGCFDYSIDCIYILRSEGVNYRLDKSVYTLGDID